MAESLWQSFRDSEINQLVNLDPCEVEDSTDWQEIYNSFDDDILHERNQAVSDGAHQVNIYYVTPSLHSLQYYLLTRLHSIAFQSL